MKEALRVIIFHFTCIVIFAFIYYSIKTSFNDENASSHKNSLKYESFLDFVLLSTTIQASVGITGIYPVNDIGKAIMIIQQMIMMSTHIFTIYLFTY
jgi:hypothetical protein